MVVQRGCCRPSCAAWFLLPEQPKFGKLCPLLRFRTRSQLEVPVPATLGEAEAARVGGLICTSVSGWPWPGGAAVGDPGPTGAALLWVASPSRGTCGYGTGKGWLEAAPPGLLRRGEQPCDPWKSPSQLHLCPICYVLQIILNEERRSWVRQEL